MDFQGDNSPYHPPALETTRYQQASPKRDNEYPSLVNSVSHQQLSNYPSPNTQTPSDFVRSLKQEELTFPISDSFTESGTNHRPLAQAPTSTQCIWIPQPDHASRLHEHGAITHQEEAAQEVITARPKKRVGGAVVGKRFGPIPGFNVGDTFDYREEFADLHPPPMAGIYADYTGAYSVVMSGGYVDDEDLGDVVRYTGEGGRANRISESSGKESFSQTQVRDQEWTRGNKGLQLNMTTRNPIRLIRGPFKKLGSPYAHPEKYRYDGLYTVEAAWQERGQEGFLMCRFEFKRLPGQPEIPRLSGEGFRPRVHKRRPSPRQSAALHNYKGAKRPSKRSRTPELPASSTDAGPSTHDIRGNSPATVKPEPPSWAASSSPSGNSTVTRPPPRLIEKVSIVNPLPSASAATFFTNRQPLLSGLRIKKETE